MRALVLACLLALLVGVGGALAAVKIIDAQSADNCSALPALLAQLAKDRDAGQGYTSPDPRVVAWQRSYSAVAVFAEQHPSCFDQKTRAVLEANYRSILANP
jgi:hypothetical protein